jgi:Tfp pilus assembly protein PilF
MLRDLEQRRSDVPTAEISWINRDNNHTVTHKKIFAGVVLFTIVIAAIIWLWRDSFLPATNASASLVIDNNLPIEHQHESSSAMVDKKISPDAAVSETVMPAPLADVRPAQLSTLRSDAVDNGLSIALQFTAPVAYQTETRSNLLRLRFSSVQQSADIVLPEIPAELAILQLIDEGNELVLTLQTRNAVSYQLRRLNDSELLIVLSGLPINAYLDHAAAEKNSPTAAASPVAGEAKTVDTVSPVVMQRPLTSVVDPKRLKQLTPQQQDQQSTRQAQQQLRNGERDKARQTLESYVGQYPQFARQAGHLLASLLIESAQPDAALTLLQTLRQSMPDDIPLRQLHAQLLLAQNNSSQALQLLREAAPSLRDNYGYYEIQAAAAQKAGDGSLAVQIYQRLLAVDKGRGDWWVGLAIALDSIQQAARASEAFRQALDDSRLAPALKQYARQRLAQLSLIRQTSNQ